MEITRVFHPVGQGAFYSEQHVCDDGAKYNVVYDCGSTSNNSSKLLNDAVRGTFNKDDEIDILFISHFHEDHVCGLSVLTDYKIKRVVLPQLDIVTKTFIYLSFANNFMNLDSKGILLQLLFEPKRLFGIDTQIIYVKQNDNIDDDSSPIDIDSLANNQEIKNGSKLFLGKNSRYWIYKIYNNIKNNNYNRSLISALNKIVGNVRSKNKVISHLLTVKDRQKLKKCYEKYGFRDLNTSSMIVYSGPYRDESVKNNYKMFPHYEWFYCKHPEVGDISKDKVGCIYTGDYQSDILIGLSKIFNTEWDDVGTIQIPHHGGLKHFEADKLFDKQRRYLCPISYGTDNSYHHPGDGVVAEIKRYENIPIDVTENKETLFIEVIKMDDNSYVQ